MPDLSSIRKNLFLLIPLSAFTIGLFPQDSSNPLMSAPSVIFSLYLLLSGRLSNINLRDPILLLLLLLWLGWTWGSIFSAVPFASEVTLLILSVAPLAYLSIANRDSKVLLYCIITLVTLLAGFSIAEIYVLPNPPWRSRLFFDDANTLGILIAFVIPVTLSFYFSAVGQRIKILFYIVLAILLGGLVCTQSRAALLGMAMGVAVVLIKNRQIFTSNNLKFIVPFAILIITGLFTTTFAERIWSIAQNDKDVIGRIAIWRSTLEMTLINPIHGVGLGIFHLQYPLYKTAEDNSAGFWVHMDPLQWAVETGWATALFFYTLAGFLFFRCFKKNLSPLQIGAAGSLLTILVAAHTSYVFHIPSILILCAIFLAQFSIPPQKKTSFRYIAVISLTMTILCGLWSTMRTMPTLYFWTQAMNSLHKSDAESYALNISRCIKNGDIRYPGCRVQAAELLINSSAEPNPEVLIWLREAEIQNPLAPEISTLRARYHAKKYPLNFKLQEEDLHQALLRDPGYWEARKMLVLLLMHKNEYDKAYQELQKQKLRWLEGNKELEYHELEKQLLEKFKK